jgi:GT2 family glycosyltransferase
MNDVQLVFANYHCAAEIAGCIRGLLAQEATDQLDIVVVENGGPAFDPTDFELPTGFNLSCVSNGNNAGYFGALIAAMKAAPSTQLRYRILCNPDLEFRDPNFFVRLRSLKQKARQAVIAPSIFSTRTGFDQNPFLVEPPSLAKLRRWKLVYSSWLLFVANDWASALKALLTKRSLAARKATRGTIYAAHGAMLVFTETFLQQEALLAQVPFLFGEELFIGEICRRHGWSVDREPTLAVWHREHATTGVLPSRRRFELQRDSMLAFAKFIR